MSPMKLTDRMEKTSTRMLPIFLWAALLYNSHDPTHTSIPVTAPQIRRRLLGNQPTSIAEMVTKALIREIIPASIDSAKAAVGFGATFTAKAHPYNTLSTKTIKEV